MSFAAITGTEDLILQEVADPCMFHKSNHLGEFQMQTLELIKTFLIFLLKMISIFWRYGTAMEPTSKRTFRVHLEKCRWFTSIF